MPPGAKPLNSLFLFSPRKNNPLSFCTRSWHNAKHMYFDAPYSLLYLLNTRDHEQQCQRVLKVLISRIIRQPIKSQCDAHLLQQIELIRVLPEGDWATVLPTRSTASACERCRHGHGEWTVNGQHEFCCPSHPVTGPCSSCRSGPRSRPTCPGGNGQTGRCTASHAAALLCFPAGTLELRV